MKMKAGLQRNERWCSPLFLVLALALTVLPLRAQEVHYLRTGTPDPVALLAPPPLPGSPEQASDLAATVAAFKARTRQEVAQAKAEKKVTVFSFAPVMGPEFTPGKFPRMAAFFKRVLKESEVVVDAGKEYWQRPRPYTMDPRLNRDGEPEQTYSYPSGHSTRGTVTALLLAELFPDKREAILALGRGIGWRRVQTGRHYPMDIYAGRTLAQAIVRELKASPAFQHDWAEVKAEVAAAGTKNDLQR